MQTQQERYEAQLKAVMPFDNMEDLSESVLDEIAQLSPHLPVVFILYYLK